MGRKCVVRQLVFVVILNLVAQNVYLSFALGCHDAEREALIKFKLSFSDPFNTFSSWKGVDCCHWSGVACNNVTGYVDSLVLRLKYVMTAQKLDPSLIVLRHLSHLDLSNNDFQGSEVPGFIGSFNRLRYLDLSDAKFGGIFSPQRGNLTRFELRHLNHLDLSGNDFQGSQIPGFIGSFKHLRYLDLSDSNFSVIFPPQLGNLTQLQYLSFSGPIGGYLQWAPALVNSQHRDINDVLISNTINIVQVLNRLSSLTYLELTLCGLTSSPHLYSLLSNSTWVSGIETLDLSENLFAGHLPNSLANMSSLIDLDLSNNSFDGSIPLWFRNFRKIKYIDLSYNYFSGVNGGMIMEILGAPSLSSLDLSFNLLRGDLGGPLVNISKARAHDLEELHFENNRISGHIPASIGNLSSLVELYLSNNSLDGAIPESLGQLNNLGDFDLSWNHLEGVVSSSHFANLSSLNFLVLNNNPLNLTFSADWRPPFRLISLDLSYCRIGAQFHGWITSQTSLKFLSLSNTDISGELSPFLCQLSHLNFIELQSNKLSGTIPDCWSSKNINFINLSSNKLSGPIPESIGQVTSLEYLNLNKNSLEGRIPPTFSSLTDLFIMDLGDNKLSGGLPYWRPNETFNLQFLRLRANNLSGVIPRNLCLLPSLQLLDLANNNLIGTIPQCLGNLADMAVLHLTTDAINLFMPYYGSVTEVLKGVELEYTRNLKFLVNLDLSSNRLVGSIPEGITNLSALIGLNFSHNYLSGGIPRKIGEMEQLESLDLSNNHISGSIPPSLSQLTFISRLNLSNNELQGRIPTGNQLQTLKDPLMIYGGNPGLCGDPLPNKCKSNHAQQQPQQEQESNKEGGREKVLLYFVIFSGFTTGFWGIVGSLLLNRRFRFALFQLVSNTADYFYVQVMVRINRLRN